MESLQSFLRVKSQSAYWQEWEQSLNAQGLLLLFVFFFVRQGASVLQVHYPSGQLLIRSGNHRWRHDDDAILHTQPESGCTGSYRSRSRPGERQ